MDTKNSAQDILIETNTQSIVANKAASDAKDADQDSITAANKADADSKNTITNDRITDEVTRIDTKDANQDSIIASNKADADSKNAATNDRVTAEVGRLDAKDVSQDNITAANKADADSKNTITNDRVTAEVGRLDDKNTDQDSITAANKADADSKNIATNNRVTNEVTRLDAKDISQDTIITQNHIDTNNRFIEANNNMNVRFTEMGKAQAITDAAQDDRIQNNSDQINELGYKVNHNEQMLSAGIASSIALSQMPTPTVAGKNMITVGSGFFNSQSALAVGMSGSTSDGKISYKVGTAWNKEGGATFGAGAGYSWN